MPPSLDEGPETSDAALLKRWREGSPTAGEQLFERYYETVRRYFRNKLPAATSADLIQETFLGCVEARARFEGQSSFRAYLLGIAHHVMIDHLRASARGTTAPVDLADLVLADIQPLPEEAVVVKRERRLLLHALRRLRFPLQVVLELRYWEGLSDSEVAEVLGDPLGTVKTRIRTARIALEEQLAQLTRSGDELRSTLDSLQRWASRIRHAAQPAGGSGAADHTGESDGDGD